MGEDKPVLIDALLTMQSDARYRMRDPDGTPADGPVPRSTSMSDNAAVWLVRIRGSLVPDRAGPGDEDITPAPLRGWMFVVINAADGQVLGYGYYPESFPVR